MISDAGERCASVVCFTDTHINTLYSGPLDTPYVLHKDQNV